MLKVIADIVMHNKFVMFSVILIGHRLGKLCFIEALFIKTDRAGFHWRLRLICHHRDYTTGINTTT